MRRNRWLPILTGLAVVATVLVGTATERQASAAPAFQLPFPCGQVWSGQTRTNHSPANAVDFNRANDFGDPVVASAGGRVSRVGNTGGTSYGRWIEIDHGSGWTSRYAHLSAQRVSVGQRVSRGQRIGDVGSSGGSTGPHLHYEQRSGGTAVKIRFNGSRIHYWGSRNYTSRNCGGGGNPYTPRQVCGSGYSVIDSARLGTKGRVYLLYNSGWNCVVTMKSANVGRPTSVSAFLEVRGKTRATDSGSYSYYAGPIRRSAPSTCVKWGGSIGATSYASPFEHCG